MAKASDLRVIKTEKLIRDAFLTLVDEKGFEALTVSDIVERAVINRSTFYSHYTDKYDLMDKIIDRIIDEAVFEISRFAGPEPHSGISGIEIYTQVVKGVFDKIDSNRKLYKTALSLLNNYRLVKKIEQLTKNKIYDNFKNMGYSLDSLPIPSDLLLEMIVSMYFGVITWWIDEDYKYPSSYMTEQVINFIWLGTGNYINMVAAGLNGANINGEKTGPLKN
ncbi:MAG: TetR/AcrR family transcriptional regulator [Bacillota bacterium]|nr:TetR/AcrR family transcriptional regulator [Bacillota bacterium]